MKAIEWRSSALCALFIAVLAWGCSGEDGKEPNGSNTGGVAAACTWSTGCLEGGSATGGTGLGGSSGAGGTGGVSGASGSGGMSGSTGGSVASGGAGASGSGNGGAASDTGDGSAGTDTGNGGASGNAGVAGTTGGGAGGDPDAGGAAGNGGVAGGSGVAGSTGGAGSGGEPDASTGGTTATGGTSGNGGAAGSAGTTSTGGSTATGGTAGADAGSDADAGAAGTSGTGGGSQDAGSEDAAPQPFSCTGWTRDTTFPAMDLTGDIWGSSASDVYVATGTYNTGEIAHFDGANWSLMTLPAVSGTWANMNAMWGSSANDVYAGGGYLPTMGSGRSRLLRRQNGGAWAIDPNFPWSSGEGKVRSIWGADASNIFVMVDYYISSKRDVKIYQKNGGSWVSMTLPAHPSPMQMNHIWGKSATEVYAAGSQLDSGNNPIEGILWKFDGSSWSKITTIPSDVVYLSDVHGTTDIVVVGYYGAPGNYRGVRLVSTDLMAWDRNNSTVTDSEHSVWTPRIGACLSGGSAFPNGSGTARLSERSLGSWGAEQPLDSIAEFITGIVPMPANQVWLATYGNGGADATVYRGTCQ